jgi:uncharacterized DUF497 family protein
VWIVNLDVSDGVLDKLQWKHAVEWHEVEEACFGSHASRRAREGVYFLYGRSTGGRYLLVVLIWLGRGAYKVASARDMEEEERRWFHNQH